jgi:hypothetical protein
MTTEARVNRMAEMLDQRMPDEEDLNLEFRYVAKMLRQYYAVTCLIQDIVTGQEPETEDFSMMALAKGIAEYMDLL